MRNLLISLLQIVGLRDFATDRRGNIALIFAAALVPVVGGLALAIDFGRASQVRGQMQIAADAAAFAAARNPDITEAQMLEMAHATFKANAPNPSHPVTFEASRDDDGVSIIAASKTDTLFARAIGAETIDVRVVSGAKAGSQDVEIALVLDNTGSMRDHMVDLRAAAKELVETVHGGAGRQNPRTKVALVPYVGAVNIGNGPTQMAWMDVDADAEFHGRMFENHAMAWEPGCHDYSDDPPGGDPPPDPGPGGGGGDRSSLDQLIRTFAAIGSELAGIRPAHAVSGAAPPAPAGYRYDWGDADCFLISPTKINHFDLFNGILGASWKGCVEARPDPYDVTDAAPDAGDPNTLFVPYFWPDEPDNSPPDWSPFPNNFMPDGDLAAFVPGLEYDWPEWNRGRNIYKYDGVAVATIDEIGPLSSGPNQACPDPIVPLTNSTVTVNSAIDALSHWEGSGTVTSEGVAWGLRVLSPTEPFTEGAAYGSAQKIMVLMTDGKNWAAEQANYTTKTDYTAYGYLYYGRTSPVTYAGYKAMLDDRTIEACRSARAANIAIYTITFGAVMDDATEELYREHCATEPPMHYSATTVADLHDAFDSIGNRIMALRLTK